MKKLTLSILSLIFLLCAAVGLVGCGKETHKHSFTEQKVEQQYLASEATCTESAKYYYSCSCGEKGTETFASGNALGHKFTNYVSDNNATCTKDGTKTAKCDRDGCNAKDIVTNTGTKLPHTFNKQVVSEKYLASAANCKQAAKYYYSCVCGEKGTQTFTSGGVGKHIYSEKWTYNATEHWHASTCGHNVESGRAKHNFVNNVCSVCEYDRTIAVTSVSLNKTTLTLNVDDTETLSATVLPTDATDKTVVWSSSNTSIATVNNGVVTAIAKGTATITAKCGNVSATCSVTVNNPYEDFTFTSTGNGYTLTAYSGNQAKVTVPSTYKGKPVTAIGERTFYDCSQITEIVLPNTIKEIGAYAFGYCTALNKIEIPSCTRVLDYAFSGCTALSEITLPDGIISLGSYLFENCNSLKKVTVLSGAVNQYSFSKSVAIEEIILGENVSSVAQRAFASCSSLKYLTMPKIDETQSFDKYYFGLNTLTYTYRGSGSDDVYPSKVDSYKYGNRVFGLPADDADWYYNGAGITVSGVYYKYDGSPVSVSAYQSWYESTVGVNYKKPKTWTATFVYKPDSPILKLTITNQTVSIYGDALKDCTCEIDIKQKFPVQSVTLVGKSELYLDELDFTNYTMKVKHTDGFEENVKFSSEYLQSDINDLKTAGKKTLSFGYGGVRGQFALTLKLHAFENVTMEDLVTVSDGTKKSLTVKGAPDGTTITYKNNDQTKAGEYTVTATLEKPYYETKVLTATIYIRQQTYKITYVIDNKDAVNNNPSEYRYGKAISLANPTSESAAFGGWYTDKNYNNKFGGITATTYGDITLYAKFTAIFTLTGNTITGLTTAGKTLPEIVIPTTVNGVKVKDIGSEAFKNCSGLKSIVIPDSVTSIGSSAFYGCSGLTEVIWNASNCTTAGSGDAPIFENCNNLTQVTIGENVKTIPSSAFRGCSGLTSVTIGNSITSIGYYAFYGCCSLTNITVANGNKKYHSEGNCLIETESKTLVFGCKSSVIPIGGSVTSIGEYAFNGCSGLTSVTIPDSVTSIGYSAFSGCSGLTSITIPNSVTSIGSYAFYGCSGLTSITIPNSVTSIGSYAFSGCSGLTSITIPNSVTSIGSYAFSGCSRLTSVTIPDSVTSIGYYAFYDCSGLKSIVIPDSVTSIGEYAFYKCRGLTSVTIGNSVTSIGTYAFSGCYRLTSVTIPDSVTSIGYYAFYDCSGLKSIVIPDSVTSIGKYAFYDCSGLKNIYYAGSIANWCRMSGLGNVMSSSRSLYIDGKEIEGELVIPNDVTSIGSYAFYGCSGLTSIVIPNSVTSIGSCAFYGCSGLTEVIWNASNCTTAVSGDAPIFGNCNNLTQVTIGENVKTIPSYAFYRCSGLTSITIPDSVTSIGSSAFSGCSGLTSITIPDSVTSIGSSAFSGCSKLKYNEFDNGLYLGNINNPYHALIGTKSADIINCIINEECKLIACSAFSDCKGLTSVTIPDSVTSIGYQAFYGCSGLTSVTIPDSVTSIGSSAFSGCTGLTEIHFNGTMAQWKAISKGGYWNYNTGKYTIYCTDGNINK